MAQPEILVVVDEVHDRVFGRYQDLVDFLYGGLVALPQGADGFGCVNGHALKTTNKWDKSTRWY